MYGPGSVRTVTTARATSSTAIGEVRPLPKGSRSVPVSAMDRAFISVAPLSSQIVVHRGFSNDQSILGSVGSHVGGVFIDNGFISTSTNEGTSKSFGSSGVLCDIIVPAGVRVVKPGTISGHSTEKEIILNRGTKFKIVSDKTVTMAQWGAGVQKRRVVLEVIP